MTSVSGAARPGRRGGRLFRLASLSLLVVGVCALPQSGCLLLDMPSFEPPQATRPLLLATNASPNPAELTRVEADGSQEFLVDVLSEDAGREVRIVMLVDYGTPNVLEYPYLDFADEKTVPSGTLAEGPRRAPTLKWFPSNGPAQAGAPGCHTITLIASHDFDDKRCPLDLEDSSQLTWIVEVCAQGGVCPTTCNPAQAGCVPFVCPQPTVACPSGAGGGGAGGAGP